VSGDVSLRKECFRMADWLFAELQQLSAEYVPAAGRALPFGRLMR